MILTPVYCSSEPPPASGPVRSKITPILIFLSWASAKSAVPNTAIAATSAPSARAVLTTSIVSLPGRCLFLLFLLLASSHGQRRRKSSALVFRTRHTHRRHCERSEAIQKAHGNSGFLCRKASSQRRRLSSCP